MASSGTEIKVTPVFKLIYRKKTDSAAGEMIEKIKDMTIVHPHTVPYFTADDVFKHILNKLDNDFIKQNTAVFASSIAAPARALHTTPADLFDFEQIQSYTDIYNEKNVDEHLQLKDITAAIYNVKNGGITADDTQGTLTVQCWISTKEKIADYNNSTNPQPPAINTFKELSRSDFKKADAATLRSMFEFKILKAEGHTLEEAKDTWKKRSIPLSGQPAYHLLSKNNDNYDVKELPPLVGMPFRMTINDGETPAHYFACSTGKLSKGSGGTEILLEGVVLRKPAGEETLFVTFVLSNNQQVTVKYPHAIH